MNLTYFFRTEEDFQRYLDEKKLDPLTNKNEPLFEYKLLDFSLSRNYDFLIITSRMAIKSLALNNQIDKNIQIILVGKKSAEFLRENNFNNILYIANDIEDLLRFIEKSFLFEKNACYLRGNYISYYICQKYKNFNEKIVYNILYKNDLSDEFKSNLKNGKIENLNFFSYKSLEEFIKICEKIDLIQYLKNINAFSMNKNSKNKFTENIFKNINIIDYF
jgi:uroporphyrinogen-III synthase